MFRFVVIDSRCVSQIRIIILYKNRFELGLVLTQSSHEREESVVGFGLS